MRRLIIALVVTAGFSVVKFYRRHSAPEPTVVAEAEKPNSTFWQLEDDSELTATLEPWPPSNGRTGLTVRATLGDWSDDANYTRDVSARLGDAGRFRSLAKSSPDAGGNLVFTGDLVMPSGPQNVQLQLLGRDDKITDLRDWTVTVP